MECPPLTFYDIINAFIENTNLFDLLIREVKLKHNILKNQIY